MARATLAAVVLFTTILGVVALWRTTVIPVSDFTSFWIAGHQLLEHRNPYDASHALQVERSMGFRESRPLVMRNPPWALWSTLPLGLLDHADARLLWTLLLVAVLCFCADRLWTLYGGTARSKSWALLVTFLFAPALACLSAGQTAPFVLLGLTLFLYLHSHREFWAGFALLLVAFKPQIAFLFWLAMLIWSIQRQKWKLLAGTASSLILATAIALALDPHVLNEYRTMLRAESIQVQFIPTFGGVLRDLIGASWLQVVPACLGVGWCSTYYIIHRGTWDWKKHMPMLLFASLLLTPYAWLSDETIILIGLIAAVAGMRLSRNAWILVLPFIVANVAILTMLIGGVRVNSPYYVWTIWVWIALYIVATVWLPNRQSQLQTASSQ